jgi:hypothetical protein
LDAITGAVGCPASSRIDSVYALLSQADRKLYFQN